MWVASANTLFSTVPVVSDIAVFVLKRDVKLQLIIIIIIIIIRFVKTSVALADRNSRAN